MKNLSEDWMIDEIIISRHPFKKNRKKLIKKLIIKQIEYGRICIAQFLIEGGQTLQTMKRYYQELDNELQNKIIKLKEKPKNHRTVLISTNLSNHSRK